MTEETIEQLIARLDKDCEETNKFFPSTIGLSVKAWARISAELKNLREELKELRACMEDVRSRVVPGEIDSSDAMLQIKRERDELRAYKIAAIAELTVARERLGPAGYTIIQECAQSRKVIEVLTRGLKNYLGMIVDEKSQIWERDLQLVYPGGWNLGRVASITLAEAEKLRGERK